MTATVTLKKLLQKCIAHVVTKRWSPSQTRHLEDHLRSTSANGHAIRGPIITCNETGFLGIRIPGLPRYLAVPTPPFSNLNEVQQQKNAVRRATIICKRSQQPEITTRLYRLTEAEKKAMDVLLTEKVRIAALMTLPKLGFDPAVAESLRLKIAKRLPDTWSGKPSSCWLSHRRRQHVIIEWADKESEVVAVPDEPRKQEPLPRKKPAPYEKVRFIGKPVEEEDSDVEEEYEPTWYPTIEHEIEVVKPKQERSVKAAKVPPKLRINVAKSKKAHVEEEMERTEEPLPTAGKGKGSITSPSSKGKEKRTTSTSPKTKKFAPEEEEAANQLSRQQPNRPSLQSGPKHPVTLRSQERVYRFKSKVVSVNNFLKEREVEPQQAVPSSSTRHVMTRRMAEAEGEESAEEPHAETEERAPVVVESGNIGRSVKPKPSSKSTGKKVKTLAVYPEFVTKSLLAYARALTSSSQRLIKGRYLCWTV
ncbi:hypothetical protein BC829DRAFT_421354 [Chytridium lagenaria]|nr:hypothetical protein BC829DRAFT_421354 [Chytridium lagenaria]